MPGILTAVLVAIVMTAIVGLLVWSIVSTLERHEGWLTGARRASRRYRVAEVKATGPGPRVTYYLPFMHVGDPRGVPHRPLSPEGERQVRDELSLLLAQLAEHRSLVR